MMHSFPCCLHHMVGGHPTAGRAGRNMAALWCCLLLGGLLAVTQVGSALAEGGKGAGGSREQASTSSQPVRIGFGSADLPANVREMHDAILAAALSGDLKELLIPIQWNELPPDFGEKPVKETLEAWRRQSHDGSGREMLALLADILASPYAVRRQGADIENALIYIWPAFAEVALDRLTPALEVALLRVVSVEEARRMKKAGRYDGYGLAIGADGTWHAFKKVYREPAQDSGSAGQEKPR